ncbi:MAG: hypothetical protein NTY09_13840 [bacterium]|nr:hypothetical protein [bacterium]
MLKNLFAMSLLGLLILLVLPTGAFALDEDSDSLQFLPSDAPVVMAVDIDEFDTYAAQVGRSWRDADTAHFFEGLQTVSYLLSRDVLKPDVLTFFGRLSGVQAFAFDPASKFPLMVFSAGNDTDGKIIGNYTVTYILERKLYESLSTIMNALESYRYDYDAETESYIHDGYPTDINDLVEFGYLDSIPINPYTGEPIKFIGAGEDSSYGDMKYEAGDFQSCTCMGACGGMGSCGMDMEGMEGMQGMEGMETKGPSTDEATEPETYSMYRLFAYCIGGVNVSPGWTNNFIPCDDFADRLINFSTDYDISSLGFEVETDGDWTYYHPVDADYSFASGGRYLLFSENTEMLAGAVERFNSGDGFVFNPPADFDTSGAFMRCQADPAGMLNGEGLMSFCPSGDCEIPPEVEAMMGDIIGKVGIEAVKMQHTACWLRNSDIEMVRRVELTGEAQGSLVGSILNAEPEPLMTAEGGPLGIIGEMAWANPNEFVHSYLDFLFENIFPMIADQAGVDPQAMLGMVGLDNINDMEFGDSMYVFVTESEDRGDGVYLPGLNAALETNDEDLFYTAVNLADTIMMSIPDLPLSQVETGDDTVFTWAFDDPEIPLTPTIALADGWIVKGLFQDDVLAIRDALANGEMLSPDGLGPANFRVRANRQRLLRGIADVAYILPDGVSAAGGILESLALMSDPDERLFAESVGNDEYFESRCYFSIDLFENLIPALSYIMSAADDM